MHQILTYANFTLSFVQTNFNQPKWFHSYLKRSDNVVSNFLLTVTGFLEVCK
jgi:hypothetical protein